MIDLFTERRQLQASTWYHKFQSEGVTPDDWRAFRKWYSKKENRQVFEDVERMDKVLQRMPTLQPLTAADRENDGYDGSVSVLRWLMTRGGGPHGRVGASEPGGGVPNISPWRYVVVVCLLAVANVLFWVLKVHWDDQMIETAIGEWHTRVLDDQSKLTIGPKTSLSVKFRDEQRVIHLSQGEALFDVASDKNRPFTVVTKFALIRAVGTQFGVAHSEDEVVVTVKEGEVAVILNDGGAVKGQRGKNPALVPQVKLYAGDQVTVSQAGFDTVQRVRVRDELSWASGRLVCHDVPLAKAVREFNRRNVLQIHVEDDALAQTKINGRFDIANPEQFAQFLTSAMPLKIVRNGSDSLRLVRVEGATKPR